MAKRRTQLLQVALTLSLVCSSFSFRFAPTVRSLAPSWTTQKLSPSWHGIANRRTHHLLQSAASSDNNGDPIEVPVTGVETARSTTTTSAAVFNLVKACCGSGVLALPAGLAVMGDKKVMAIPASFLILFTGSLSAYTFQVLGRLCEKTGATGLGELWEKSFKHSWIVDLCTIITCVGVCLTYSIVLGDFLSDIVQNRIGREACLVGITLSCLYPLALLPSLNSLAPVSKTGVYGTFFACAVLIFRCTISNAYTLPGGRFLSTVPALPSFAKRAGPMNPLSPLVLTSIASQSFLCHFTAPDFLQSVSNSLSTYKKVTVFGFGATALINIAVLVSGFLTFGGSSAGVILNSYSNQDVLVGICRILMAVSVIGSFPFMIRGTRNAMYSLFKMDAKQISRRERTLTSALVASVTLPALVVRNAGLVVSLNGALMGSAITYIFPAMLFLKSKLGTAKERLWMRIVLMFGVFAGLVGGAVSILSECAPHLLL